MSLLREPGLSPVYAQIFLVPWFLSGSVQSCCCWCSDKGWHLKTVCSLCRKLMLLNHVEHKIVGGSHQWCFWRCLVCVGGHCVTAGIDSFVLYPGLRLLSPGWRWCEVLLGTLPLCGKVTLAYIFHIWSPPQFFISFYLSLFFPLPYFDLNNLYFSFWLNCQVNSQEVLLQVNTSGCPLFFMCLFSHRLLNYGF